MAPDPRFSPDVNARIVEAHKLATGRGDTHSDVPHLLFALLEPESGQATRTLRETGHDVDELRNRAVSILPSGNRSPRHHTRSWSENGTAQVTSGFMAVLDMATEMASSAGDREVDELHLLRAMLNGDGHGTERVLDAIDLTSEDSVESTRPRALEELSRYGRVLTDEARAGTLDPVIGRVAELERVTHILGRRRKNNPVLLGEPGVGKTAIVEGLAQAIVESRVPGYLTGREIFVLDVGSLVAGTKYRGEFESRIQDLLESIRSSDGRIIMFIDELHLIARAGGAEGAIDAAGFLKPMLARGELKVIGATTLDDYRRQVVGDGALERRFQPVPIKEPSPEEALEMVRGLRPSYEKHHGVSISDGALRYAVEASHERIPYRHLPDKAIDLIDEASSRKRARAEAASSPAGTPPLELVEDDLTPVLEAWVGDGNEGWSREVYGDTPDG